MKTSFLKKEGWVKVRKGVGGCRRYKCDNYPYQSKAGHCRYNNCCKLCRNYRPFNFYERRTVVETKNDKVLLRRKRDA